MELVVIALISLLSIIIIGLLVLMTYELKT